DQVGERGARGRSRDLVRHRARVVEPDGCLEIAFEPGRERVSVHPAVADPAVELELFRKVVWAGLGGDRTDTRAGSRDVARDDVDGAMSGARVIVHTSIMVRKAGRLMTNQLAQTGVCAMICQWTTQTAGSCAT